MPRLMDAAVFEQLLYEEESTTLDFKRDQYRFVKAADEEKSELLKDILGFANAWRRSEAYILIGVEDVRGGRGNVVGIAAADHLDDHALQQFVNNLTNRPVQFHYEAFGFEEKQVGIVRIEQQPRPVYLKRDFGKLKKNQVYVRRGSSTDPQKPATLEEVAQMGHTNVPEAAELSVEFSDVERDVTLGRTISWDAEFCQMPPFSSIPDLEEPELEQTHPFLNIHLPILSDPLNQLNSSYYRELAEYEFARRLLRPVRLAIRNIGQTAANHVRVELTVRRDIGAVIVDQDEIPERPAERSDIVSQMKFKGIGAAIRPPVPGAVVIDKDNDRFLVQIDCGSLQPGRRVISEVFYIGKGQSGELLLTGQVFADNLPKPKAFELTVVTNVNQTQMTVDELMELQGPPDSAEDV